MEKLFFSPGLKKESCGKILEISKKRVYNVKWGGGRIFHVLKIFFVFHVFKYYFVEIRGIFHALSANPQNGQTHLNNSSAVAEELFESI